jgi:hypothetical protein
LFDAIEQFWQPLLPVNQFDKFAGRFIQTGREVFVIDTEVEAQTSEFSQIKMAAEQLPKLR